MLTFFQNKFECKKIFRSKKSYKMLCQKKRTITFDGMEKKIILPTIICLTKVNLVNVIQDFIFEVIITVT